MCARGLSCLGLRTLCRITSSPTYRSLAGRHAGQQTREHHPALAATWHIRESTWPSPSKSQSLQTLMFEKARWLSFAPFPPNLKSRQWNIKIKPQRRISTGYHWGSLTGVSRWSRPALNTAQQVTRAPLFCSREHPSTRGVSLLGFCLSHNTFFALSSPILPVIIFAVSCLCGNWMTF